MSARILQKIILKAIAWAPLCAGRPKSSSFFPFDALAVHQKPGKGVRLENENCLKPRSSDGASNILVFITGVKGILPLNVARAWEGVVFSKKSLLKLSVIVTDSFKQLRIHSCQRFRRGLW